MLLRTIHRNYNTVPKGYALLIGLNYLDASHYGGWDGALKHPENDVKIMEQIAREAGLQTTLLLNKAATRENVIDRIMQFADLLEPDDLLFLYYSGHGGQLPDLSGDEPDRMDETWCLYDGQLVDDEIFALWGTFRQNVRIILISDSCHSGTVGK